MKCLALMLLGVFVFECYAKEISAVEDACQKSVDRYEMFCRSNGRDVGSERRTIKTVVQKNANFAGSFYSCNVGGAYNVEVGMNGEILSFKCLDVIAKFFPSTDKMALKKDIPAWTNEIAAQKAMQFASAILGKEPSNLGKPTAKFESNQVYGKRYEPGTWTVWWPRIDKNGYPFYIDGMNVVISESVGGTYMCANFTSRFQGVNGETMSRTNALVFGHKYAKGEAVKNAARRLRVPSISLAEDPVDEGLVIMRPERGQREGGSGVNESRLAWSFSFQFIHNGEKLADGVTVFIDAENGDVLAEHHF